MRERERWGIHQKGFEVSTQGPKPSAGGGCPDRGVRAKKMGYKPKHRGEKRNAGKKWQIWVGGKEKLNSLNFQEETYERT